jgi:hypothetical protein
MSNVYDLNQTKKILVFSYYFVSNLCIVYVVCIFFTKSLLKTKQRSQFIFSNVKFKKGRGIVDRVEEGAQRRTRRVDPDLHRHREGLENLWC